MTSKISFCRLLKEDFKRRSWLIALVSLACFYSASDCSAAEY